MVNKPAAFHRGCWLPTAAVRSMQSYEKYSERQCRPWLFRGGPCCAVCRVILSEIRLPVGGQIVMLSVLNSFYLFLPAMLSGRTAVAAMPNGPYCGPIRVVSRPEMGRLVVQDGPFGARPLPPGVSFPARRCTVPRRRARQCVCVWRLLRGRRICGRRQSRPCGRR